MAHSVALAQENGDNDDANTRATKFAEEFEAPLRQANFRPYDNEMQRDPGCAEMVTIETTHGNEVAQEVLRCYSEIQAHGGGMQAWFSRANHPTMSRPMTPAEIVGLLTAQLMDGEGILGDDEVVTSDLVHPTCAIGGVSESVFKTDGFFRSDRAMILYFSKKWGTMLGSQPEVSEQTAAAGCGPN